jgi:acyl carrier protein
VPDECAGGDATAWTTDVDDHREDVMFTDRVRTIWCRELQRDDISVDDDFFALGGHSVIMARIQAAFIEELGVEVPVDRMFLNPTVAGISAYLESRVAKAP